MKKRILLSSVALLFLLLIGVYIFVPSKLTIGAATIVPRPSNAVFRIISDESTWQKWFPGKVEDLGKGMSGSDSGLLFNGFSFARIKPINSAIAVHIGLNTDSVNSFILIFQKSGDSSAIRWECSIPASLNPIKRIIQYRKTTGLRKDMDFILKSFSSFLDKTENIYGLHIEKVSTQDTLLLCSKSVTSFYPSTVFVYHQIQELKDYIRKQKVMESGAPMLNIFNMGNHQFETRLAIPVSGKIEGDGKIYIQKMIQGNFMSAQVQGGLNAVKNGLNQMELYFDDYNKTPMAIPFQSLLTDRIAEKDSSRWITRLYFPVLQ